MLANAKGMIQHQAASTSSELSTALRLVPTSLISLVILGNNSTIQVGYYKHIQLRTSHMAM